MNKTNISKIMKFLLEIRVKMKDERREKKNTVSALCCEPESMALLLNNHITKLDIWNAKFACLDEVASAL